MLKYIWCSKNITKLLNNNTHIRTKTLEYINPTY